MDLTGTGSTVFRRDGLGFVVVERPYLRQIEVFLRRHYFFGRNAFRVDMVVCTAGQRRRAFVDLARQGTGRPGGRLLIELDLFVINFDWDAN